MGYSKDEMLKEIEVEIAHRKQELLLGGVSEADIEHDGVLIGLEEEHRITASDPCLI